MILVIEDFYVITVIVVIGDFTLVTVIVVIGDLIEVTVIVVVVGNYCSYCDSGNRGC